jgi:hypothetical protein
MLGRCVAHMVEKKCVQNYGGKIHLRVEDVRIMLKYISG